MSQEKKLMSTGEFAKQAGISTAKVSKLIRDGRIKATKVSGRWRIDPGQLKAVTAEKPGIRSPAKKAKPSPKKSVQTKKTKPASSQKGFSIGEFAKMSYLTERGVVDWLKSGRLKGQMAKNGDWSVDAANLDVADISRLIRK